jgi:hypothetical protein
MNGTKKKIAFVHFAKAAGRYINHYLCSRIFGNGNNDLAKQKYKIFNSWQAPFSLHRDWTEPELIQIAGNRFPAQYPTPAQVRMHHARWDHDYLDCQYVHNHQFTWTGKAIQHFRRHGWFIFMFIRDPAELLCSIWTWIRETGTKSPALIEPARLAELGLDSFLREMVTNPECHGSYGLPSYADQLDYLAEFTEDNFGRFLLDHFDHRYQPQRLNTHYRFASGNPGYTVYRSRGLISDETHELLNQDIDVRRVRERLSTDWPCD